MFTVTVPLTALAGSGLGWLAWLLARYYVSCYRALAPTDGMESPAGPAQTSVGTAPALALILQAVMALWGAYVGWRAPGLAATTSALVVTTLLLTVTLVDFQVRKIPKELIVALLVWAVVQALWLGRPSLAMAGLGMAIGGGIFFLLAQTSRGAMGMGDVKLMAAGGALTGIPLIFPAMLLGVLAGGTAALVLLLTRRVTRKTPIAYGPYLSLGTWLALTQLWGLWPGWQM